MSDVGDVLERVLRRINGDDEKDFNVDCPFCDNNTSFIKVFSGKYISLSIENCYGDVYIIANGDNSISYKPKYCPNCGRKLQEVEE